MTTRGEINSNFYQIVNVDGNGAPTSVKGQYITSGNVDNALHANVADVANNVSVGNITGIGNIAVLNLDGNSGNILYGNGIFAAVPNVSNTANANYANFAGTAFNVSGSNVSGTVANANYSAYAGQANTANLATFATTANSVAVANVSGIGNIATTNYDGNASNVLYGNGGFYALPTISNVANANYANFAGTAYSVSGANVSGEVANANFASYANLASTANLATFATTANSVAGANVSGEVANANYASFANIAASANSVAVANVSGIGNIATVNLDGNASNILFGNGVFSAIPVVSNVANANYANFAGTAYSVSGANVSGEVANANFASYANIASTANLATYATTANSVAGANVSGEVANANYASYANIAASANSVAVANVSGIGNIATINLDGNVSNLLTGTGTWVAIPTVSANANYANFAGQVVDNTQSNITQTGNLVSLNINNGVAGSTTKQFQPNGVTIISTANTNLMSNSSFVDIDYGNGQGDGNVLLGKSQTYLKTRGNAASQTTANVNDRVGRTNYSFYNGTSNVLAAATQVVPFVSFNANANAVTTAGQFQIITGNPNGDQGNANALSNQNVISADPYGRLQITQGAAGSTSSALSINTYGGSSGNGANPVQQITFLRLRGNRDGNLSVWPNDQLGGMQFTGWNGTGQFATRFPSVTAYVDSSYVANTTAIPAGIRMQVVDNTTTYTHQFYANGNVLFNSGKTVTAGFYYGDGSNLTGIIANTATTANFANYAGNVTVSAQPNITSVGNTLSSGQLNLNATGAGGPQLNINGNSTAGNTGTMTLKDTGLSVNIDGANYPGGAPSFSFNTYQTGGVIPPQFYKRYGGTEASPSGVANGDAILNQYYQVYGDSGNTNMTIGGSIAGVGNIASAGNISFNYQIYGSGNANDKYTATFPTIELLGNVTGNTFTGNGNGLSNIQGANVSGAVSFATVANSVSVGNVSGIGNIATVNLDGNSSNVLYGNGVFAAGGGTYGNSNVATFLASFGSNTITTTGNVSVGNIIGNGQALTGVNASGMNISNANAGSNISMYPVFANGTGNQTLQIDNSGSTIVYNPSTGVLTYASANVNSVGNDTGGENIFFDGTNNSIRMSTTSGANALTVNSSGISTTGRIQSTVATGTAPLDIASTTLVPNLHVARANSATYVLTTSQAGAGYLVGTTVTSGNTTIGIAATGIGYSGGTVSAGAFQSNNVTGTAPLFVSSTTLVPNLHVARANIADTANSVAVANVSGIGNIATINLTGSTSNVLYGNGVFAPISITSVANANYANFAGEAFSVAAANISGTVNLANFATTANSVAGANVSGQVSFAATANSVSVGNVSGIGNIATVNLDGNASNLLYGNGVFAPISISSVANANYANFAGTAYSVSGANVSGQVANSLIAGTVYTNAQPNITSVGTLTSLTVSGNLVPTNLVLDSFNETVVAGGNTSTSISPNVANGTIFNYTANANFTFNSLTSVVAGTSATVIITQDATGNRLLTSTMLFAGASKTLSTAASAKDIISVFYDGTNYFATLSKGYA